MKKIFSIILASVAMISCVDTVILPDNKTVDEDFWQKKTEVDAVVATAYAQLRDASAIRNMIVWGDFRSDELVIAAKPTDPYYVALQQIYSLNIEPENTFTSWYPFYSAINYCNLVLEKSEGVMSVDPDYMQGDYECNKAQMLALRAFCYFYLSRVFHDIPVTSGAYLNSSDELNAIQKSPDEVITMCISDLVEASKYAVSANTFGDWRDKGYLNKDGINALLADIYLWRASVNRDSTDYLKCVEYCDLVIKAKKEAYEQKPKHGSSASDVKKDYYLSEYDDMYGDIFGENGQNSDESIFELQFKNSAVNNTGLDQMYFRFKDDKSTYGYLKAFKMYGKEDNTGGGVWNNAVDQRLFEFFYDANSPSMDQYGVRKFVATRTAGKATSQSARETRSDFQQNWIFYRLTDVMLMKAEALVQLYNLAGKQASDTRNQDAFDICKVVNDRALTDPTKCLYYTVCKDKMEEVVLAERVRELCFEGKRWYDLMRYNYRHTTTQANLRSKLTEGYVVNSDEFFSLALRKYESAQGAMKTKMPDERYLYMPINQDEVEINTNLVQNPVYQSTSTR